MTFCFISLFPNLIAPYFAESILKKAIDNGLLNIELCNLRDFSNDKHNRVDEPQISGGAGQVLKPQIINSAINHIKNRIDSHIIFLSPCGKKFSANDALRLSKKSHISFVCGRYEGFDERSVEVSCDEIFSIGDFILSGGEIAALALSDSIARQIQGVLGNEDSLKGESFESNLLESPTFIKVTKKSFESSLKNATKMRFFPTPSIYSQGNHKKINNLKKALALCKTRYFRPDLYQKIKNDE